METIKINGRFVFDIKAEEVIEKVIEAMLEVEQNPTLQLTNYLISGEPLYITKNNGARELIQEIDIADIIEYLANKEIQETRKKIEARKMKETQRYEILTSIKDGLLIGDNKEHLNQEIIDKIKKYHKEKPLCVHIIAEKNISKNANVDCLWEIVEKCLSKNFVRGYDIIMSMVLCDNDEEVKGAVKSWKEYVGSRGIVITNNEVINKKIANK